MIGLAAYTESIPPEILKEICKMRRKYRLKVLKFNRPWSERCIYLANIDLTDKRFDTQEVLAYLRLKGLNVYNLKLRHLKVFDYEGRV